MRVVLYARVSTIREQKTELQIEEMRKYCIARGWDVVDEAVDRGYSGASDRRPGLDRLLYLVRARKVDGVVTLKLDRLFRSLQHLTKTLSEFQDLGVTFTAINDQIDLSTASGKLMMHLIGAFAEFEHSLIKERSRLGMEFARSQGKQIGRPKLYDERSVIEARAKGWSYRQIEKELAVPMGVISRILRDARLRGDFKESPKRF